MPTQRVAARGACFFKASRYGWPNARSHSVVAISGSPSAPIGQCATSASVRRSLAHGGICMRKALATLMGVLATFFAGDHPCRHPAAVRFQGGGYDRGVSVTVPGRHLHTRGYTPQVLRVHSYVDDRRGGDFDREVAAGQRSFRFHCEVGAKHRDSLPHLQRHPACRQHESKRFRQGGTCLE